TGPGYAHTFTGDQAAELGERIHRGPGGNDKRALLIRHFIGNWDQGIDVVYLIFAEAAVGRESVRTVTFVNVAVIEAVVVTGGVHALAASFALSEAGVNLNRHTLSDFVLIDAGSERHACAHVFMAGREILIERQTALDRGGRTAVDNFKIGSADCY